MLSLSIFSTNGIEIEFDENFDEVLDALQNAADRGLRAIGEKAVGYAQDKVPKDTGRLAGSITYEVGEDEVYIGTNVLYAPYVEMGTGKYSTTGGRQTPWFYQDRNGNWHKTEGQKPQPYLKPAASEHGDEYRQILKDSLENA